MPRLLCTFFLLTAHAAIAEPWFDGSPAYADAASKALAMELLEAHGGMAPMTAASSLNFSFFTKMIGNPTAFYSNEALDLATGNAYVDWPFWDASIVWDREALWTENWPMPLPGGFFVRLTSTFITLPWQLHADDARVGPVSQDSLPNDERVYDVLHITFSGRGPMLPGTFYDLFVDPETRLMKAIRFDINHPGMVANPSQPLGPNYHVFGDYRDFNGLAIPTFYMSYGQGSSDGGESNAYHFVWDLSTDQEFDQKRLTRSSNAVLDDISIDWWQVPSEQDMNGGRKQ